MADFNLDVRHGSSRLADPQWDKLALRHPHQFAVLRRAILCFLLGDLAPQQIRIEATVQGYRRDRNTRLHAFLYYLGLELGAVPTSAPYWRTLSDSVHVSTQNQMDMMLLATRVPFETGSPGTYSPSKAGVPAKENIET